MIKPSSGGFDMHKWADSKKIIKELEQKQMKLNGQCIEYIRKIDKLEQKLERYKEYVYQMKKHLTDTEIILLEQEFEEAKE